MNNVSEQDRVEVLDELAQYYLDQAAAVSAIRGQSPNAQPQEIVSDKAFNIKIDPAKKAIILTW